MTHWWVVYLLVGCGGASSPSNVSSTCRQACEEYIEPNDSEQREACSDALDLCYSSCEEVTAGAAGACLVCLADAIVGPYPYRTSLPEDTGRNTGPYLCELGQVDGDCTASCL